MDTGRVDTRAAMHTGTAGQAFGKRVLVEISHALEQFALAAPPGEPLIVIALFQKLSYFEREAEVYAELAARGALTVVGLTEDLPPRLPPGVNHALFGRTDPLSHEWSVTVLGPRGGATLVARDLEAVDPHAPSLDHGRLFQGHWSFRRDDAYREILRLRQELNLSLSVLGRLDAQLRHVVAAPEPDEEGWREAPLRFFTRRVDDLLREGAVARRALQEGAEGVHERDARSGLPNQRFLDRWTTGLADGTLPIGLALLRVAGVTDLRSRYGLRAELAALQTVARCLQETLTGADRAVRLAADDFLIVLPARTPEQVRRHADDVTDRIARLDRAYPFVSLPATAAVTVTRGRPLPLPQLRGRLEESSAGMWTAALV